jgi:hypothetical protein
MNPLRRAFATAALLAGLLPAPSAFGWQAQAGEIADKMTGVVDGLGRKATGPPVQGKQKEIVQDLDALIAELEKQIARNGEGMKRNDPRMGMDDSRIGSGTGGIGTLVNPAEGGKDWGKLSDRERDRILQSMGEGFPPEYRTVLERYYRRLAEEKSARGPSDPSPKPAGSAAPAAPPAPARP